MLLTRRQWDKARRVPPSWPPSRPAPRRSATRPGWRRARPRISPPSRRSCSTTSSSARRYVECHQDDPDFDCAYDVLLDDYEPRMQTAHGGRLFGELKAELVPMIAQIAAGAAVDDSALYTRFPVEGQRGWSTRSSR